jgi:formate-dependent nitrite reductase membrane component NrfD
MTDFTPQEEWINKKGLFLWLAFFFSEIGAGIYVVSLLFEFWEGCMLGWILAMLVGGGFHTLYLGKPERAWRVMLRPGKSELSRGLIVLLLFMVIGVLQLLPALSYFSWLPWQSGALLFKVTMTILGLLVIMHGFMTINIIAGIPFWNSGIIPVLSLSSGVWLGTQIVMGFSACLGQTEILQAIETLARWSLFSYVFLAIFYFWNISHSSLAAQNSLKEMIRGDLAPLFYIGVLLIAFIVPVCITLYFWKTGLITNNLLFYLRIICAILGDLSLRYCIFKAARYSPLI